MVAVFTAFVSKVTPYVIKTDECKDVEFYTVVL
jgi:hypothetical protein